MACSGFHSDFSTLNPPVLIKAGAVFTKFYWGLIFTNYPGSLI
jgi:hypothetical protein